MPYLFIFVVDFMLYIFTTFLGMHALSITNKKNVESDFQAESAYSHPGSILMIIHTNLLLFASTILICEYEYPSKRYFLGN